jgi:hypothetical protein
MKKTKKGFFDYTQYPELAKKVISQIGLPFSELCKHPDDYRTASHGVPGFVYYYDTVRFGKRNLVLIMQALNSFERECGILDKPTDDETQYFNWLAWFALEAVISELIYYMED